MSRLIAVTMMVLALGQISFARGPRDPLTKIEVEQMREIADQPVLRMKLMVKFAQSRMTSIDEARAQKPSANRTELVHNFLEDFSAIIDELDDNLDMYDRQRADLRKALKLIIEADTGFSAKLRALKAEATPPGSESEVEDFGFALDNAITSVNDNIATAREMLTRQGREVELEKHKK